LAASTLLIAQVSATCSAQDTDAFALHRLYLQNNSLISKVRELGGDESVRGKLLTKAIAVKNEFETQLAREFLQKASGEHETNQGVRFRIELQENGGVQVVPDFDHFDVEFIWSGAPEPTANVAVVIPFDQEGSRQIVLYPNRSRGHIYYAKCGEITIRITGIDRFNQTFEQNKQFISQCLLQIFDFEKIFSVQQIEETGGNKR